MPTQLGDAALLAWLSGQNSAAPGTRSSESQSLHDSIAAPETELSASIDKVFESLGRFVAR
jgi:hypothetical protein